MNFIVKLLDANTLGGWVRAGVSAGLGLLIAKSSTLAAVLDPTTQTSIAALASTLVVGFWSQIAKSYSA